MDSPGIAIRPQQLFLLANEAGFCVSEVSADSRPTWEKMALERQLPLALSDLGIWRTTNLSQESQLYTIHDAHKNLAGAFAIQRYASNILPMHHVLRLEKLGEVIPKGAELAVASALRNVAHKTRGTLRLVAELHDRDPWRRARIAGALRGLGFERQVPVRTYERTLAINLQRDDSTLLASFSASARQSLRLAERTGVSVATIDSNEFQEALTRIHAETYARTGGQSPAPAWKNFSAAAREFPDRLKLFGATINNSGQPRLVAYAKVLRHGSYAVYDSAGSTRLMDRRLPLMYPVMWALIRWARDSGAEWLDLGGVSAAGDKVDPLAGISDFKRKFHGEEIEVGEDWEFTVAPLRQQMVRSVGSVHSWLQTNR